MIRDPETGELTIALTPPQSIAAAGVVLVVVLVAVGRRRTQ
ncbi:MAG: hypothetical protein R6X29_06870 [Acidimicrobiia bacterium]|jgi:hypothetical protein